MPAFAELKLLHTPFEAQCGSCHFSMPAAPSCTMTPCSVIIDLNHFGAWPILATKFPSRSLRAFKRVLEGNGLPHRFRTSPTIATRTGWTCCSPSSGSCSSAGRPSGPARLSSTRCSWRPFATTWDTLGGPTRRLGSGRGGPVMVGPLKLLQKLGLLQKPLGCAWF